MKSIINLGYNKMFLRKLKNSNNGVVGIVVAVLLIGLLVTFISIIQLYYVPKWMKEKEAEHMTLVANQFSQLKFAIDSQIALGNLGKTGIPMTSPFTLGSTELPFFVSMPAYGDLDIIDNVCNITIEGDPPRSYSLGIIRFSSINAYLEDQSFVYESGAVITSQTEGNIVAIKPFFKPSEFIEDPFNLKINFTLINISSIGGKTTSQTSTDTTAIQTEYSYIQPDPYNITINDVETITIVTSYPNAWDLFISSILKNAGWSDDYFSIDKTSAQIIITFENSPTIILEEYRINAQIGPGWIQK